MSHFDSYDDDELPPTDGFAAALTILSAAMSAKDLRKKVLQLKKLENDIEAASAALSRLQDQSRGILEGARAEAEKIIAEAEAETKALRADIEARESAVGYSERFNSKREAVRARAGFVSADAERQIAEEICAEDNGDGHRVSADVGDEHSDHQGNSFVQGSTVTRSTDHKRRVPAS